MGIIRADERNYNDYGWLKTFWLFSFGDYYDPQNVRHGSLRVFNDDVVEAGTGFPTHPHDEMEIITIVLDGEMTHRDSMGNKAVIRTGDVQRMSAGTGLTHSEYNLSDRPVHFYQVWIFPGRKGLKPSYDQKSFDPSSWRNRLFPVASGRGIGGTVTFHADATIFRCSLDEGVEVSHDEAAGRNIFIYVTSGEVEVDGVGLDECDQARLSPEGPVKVKALSGAEFILVDTK